MALSELNRSVRLFFTQIQRCRVAANQSKFRKSFPLHAAYSYNVNCYCRDLCDVYELTGINLRLHMSCSPVRCMNQAACQPQPSPNENEAVNPTFENRNPRNLEFMALAVKDRGWKTTWPHREFYHRSVER